MIEREGDLWEIAASEGAVVVITTNGSVRKDGCCVMGRGCALEAKRKFPGIARQLGDAIIRTGNHANVLYVGPPEAKGDADPHELIITFPVKHAWNESAELALISRSSLELCDILAAHGIKRVVMPRPGCGNGRLRWTDVKPTLEAMLPGDRFIVVHRKGEV